MWPEACSGVMGVMEHALVREEEKGAEKGRGRKREKACCFILFC